MDTLDFKGSEVAAKLITDCFALNGVCGFDAIMAMSSIIVSVCNDANIPVGKVIKIIVEMDKVEV